MSNMTNEDHYEIRYEMGFDDGYNQAIQDLHNKFRKHLDDMVENISKEIMIGELKI